MTATVSEIVIRLGRPTYLDARRRKHRVRDMRIDIGGKHRRSGGDTAARCLRASRADR